jgi:hypothetical protein
LIESFMRDASGRFFTQNSFPAFHPINFIHCLFKYPFISSSWQNLLYIPYRGKNNYNDSKGVFIASMWPI